MEGADPGRRVRRRVRRRVEDVRGNADEDADEEADAGMEDDAAEPGGPAAARPRVSASAKAAQGQKRGWGRGSVEKYADVSAETPYNSTMRADRSSPERAKHRPPAEGLLSSPHPPAPVRPTRCHGEAARPRRCWRTVAVGWITQCSRGRARCRLQAVGVGQLDTDAAADELTADAARTDGAPGAVPRPARWSTRPRRAGVR